MSRIINLYKHFSNKKILSFHFQQKIENTMIAEEEEENEKSNESDESFYNSLFKPGFNKVEEYLYLGDVTTASDTMLLETCEIKRLLTLYKHPLHTEPFSQEVLKLGIQFKFIKLEDKASEDILSYLPECIKFICEGQSNKENVFVHCAAGVSLSASIVIALIMHKYGYSFRNARDVVKGIRPSIQPKEGFVDQLYIFERLNGKIDASDWEFRLFLLMGLINFLRAKDYNNFSEVKSSNEFLEALNHYFEKLKMAQNNSVMPIDCGRQYLCRKCNSNLFNEINVIRTDRTETQCIYLFIEPQKWMTHLVDSKPILPPYGKIICIQCQEIVGDYNVRKSGFVCECPQHKPFSPRSAHFVDYSKKKMSNYKCLVFRIQASKLKDQTS